GVYARNNAVDMAARLPDGSASEMSVSALLQTRTVDQTNGGGEDK
ncbi:MAG: NADH-quinone oxidoreductase subunit J, partial [Mycobacterium sp.]